MSLVMPLLSAVTLVDSWTTGVRIKVVPNEVAKFISYNNRLFLEAFQTVLSGSLDVLFTAAQALDSDHHHCA